jgi:predicted glycosyltransferase
MKILFFLGHPAHYHLHKHTIWILKQKGHEVSIYIKTKDILEDLLRETGLRYTNVLPEGRKDRKLSILLGVFKRDWRLFKLLFYNKVDLLLGSEPSLAHIGKLLRIPSLIFVEDDVRVIPEFAKLTFPFATHVVSPVSCELGSWSKKKIAYHGYQKLSYLHPTRFTPELRKISGSIDTRKRIFFILISKLSDHNDYGILKKYELNKINPKDIHHLLFYSDLLISDSQSMSVEAAMLGTPSIRFSDFAGKIGVLEELEHKYGLTHGVETREPDKLLEKIIELVNTPNLKEIYQKRREKMLQDKIDVTALMVWLVENYPESVRIMKEAPDYQYRFK